LRDAGIHCRSFAPGVALFGGLAVSLFGGLIPLALFGHPWGDIVGQVIFVTCWLAGLTSALECRLPKKLGIALPLTVANIFSFEYFRWNRAEPFAVSMLVVAFVTNIGLLSWLRPWRGDARSIKVTFRRS
jgi:hypothetical protein